MLRNYYKKFGNMYSHLLGIINALRDYDLHNFTIGCMMKSKWICSRDHKKDSESLCLMAVNLQAVRKAWLYRLKIKIFNREICVCALLATNSFIRREQCRNEENYEEDHCDRRQRTVGTGY